MMPSIMLEHLQSDAAATYETSQKPMLWILDDDSDYCKLIAIVLQNEGFIVRTFTDPRSFLTESYTVGVQLPHCIVLDVMMPEFDGFDIARAWRIDESHRVDGRRIPIVMLTALGDVPYNVGLSIQAGADGYFTKPTHPRDMSQKIRELLSRKAQGDIKNEDFIKDDG